MVATLLIKGSKIVEKKEKKSPIHQIQEPLEFSRISIIYGE